MTRALARVARAKAPEALQTAVEAIRYELARARVIARAWADTVTEARRIDQAALFGRVAMETFAAEVAPGLQLSRPFAQPFGKLDSTAKQLAQAIGRQAASLPVIEAAHYLTGLYTALLPGRHRSDLGAFYTPPALSIRLLDLAQEEGLDWSTARVLDPACGGGAFLLQAAARIRTALEGSEPAFILSHMASRLLGLELDAHAAGFAQAALEVALADLAISSGRPVPRLVKVCDTLEEPPTPTFDLVVGNPPYGRVALTVEQRRRYARSLYGHANLYGVFTDIALRWAKPGGFVAYLTPTSVLGGQYYAALRGLLAREAPPVAIDFVHARRGVFEDVLQETLLALYRPGGKAGRVQVHYLRIPNEREAEVQRNGTIKLPDDPTAPWMAPRDPAHSALIARIESMTGRLADWGYSVSTGPLVWNRFKSQLRERPSKGAHPLIWAEAVTADGRFVFRAQKRNHSPYFKLERGDAWLLVEEPCVLLQRTTAKEQARRLIAAELPESFIRDHGGVVVENHLNMIIAEGVPSVSPAAVAAVLNSDMVDQVFRCISGSVAVSAFELKSIPFPPAEAMKEIERLVAKKAKRATIEKAVRALYGEVDQ